MRSIERCEAELVSGGLYAQVMGCVAGAVGMGVGYAQGSGTNGTAAGAIISIGGGCASGIIGTVPGLGSSAMTVGFFASQLANAYTPTAEEVQQGYRNSGGSCVPLPGSAFSLTDMFRYRDPSNDLASIGGTIW